jgi:dihydrolipoamide dehydrogenase
VSFGDLKIDVDALRARKDEVIGTLSNGLAQLAKRRSVKRVTARGIFVDSQTLQLEGGDTATYSSARITFERCILATGSRPVIPKPLRLESDRIMDSARALQLPDVPSQLLVIGGGYIGLEMSVVYAELGSRVTVVEMTSELLPGVDRDLVKPLQNRLETRLERILLNTKVAHLADRGDQLEATLEGPDRQDPARFDRVLVCVGRRPATSGLGLENTHVTVDERGFVIVDPKQQTTDPHIWAIGDVAGEPMLAHKAAHQGKVAAEVIAGEPAAFDVQAIPAVVFTDPEIAWAGLSEAEAHRQGRRVSVAQYPWQASGRATAVGRTDGLTKWIVDPDTERLLGAGIVGAGAGELIAEAVLAIEMGCTARDVAQSIHPHPTLSETVGFASEVMLGTATEIYRPRRKAAKAESRSRP